ncbi:MAG: GNAT family N-acetyltransferase [Stellaceae bacterium]
MTSAPMLRPIFSVAFFAEEGFAGDPATIAANFEALRRAPDHWAAAAMEHSRMVGIATVTTMLYVEWGRLGEIGDLYVLPGARRRGIAGALVHAAIEWCRLQGCSAVEVVITAEGERTHGLSRFYQRLGFAPTGRTMSLLRR